MKFLCLSLSFLSLSAFAADTICQELAQSGVEISNSRVIPIKAYSNQTYITAGAGSVMCFLNHRISKHFRKISENQIKLNSNNCSITLEKTYSFMGRNQKKSTRMTEVEKNALMSKLTSGLNEVCDHEADQGLSGAMGALYQTIRNSCVKYSDENHTRTLMAHGLSEQRARAESKSNYVSCMGKLKKAYPHFYNVDVIQRSECKDVIEDEVAAQFKLVRYKKNLKISLGQNESILCQQIFTRPESEVAFTFDSILSGKHGFK